MVEDFEQCKSKFVCMRSSFKWVELTKQNISLSASDAPPSEARNTPQPRTAQAQPVRNNNGQQTVDDPGLFMTDTMPTPFEDLLRGSNGRGKAMPSRAKRKFAEDVTDATEGGDGDKPRSLKKAKIHGKGLPKAVNENSHTAGRRGDARHRAQSNDKEDLQNGGRLGSALPTEHSGARQQDAPEPEPDDDSFVREVEELLAIREEKKRKRANKKRKRESGGSDVQRMQAAVPPDGDEADAGKPMRKKAKTSKSVTASDHTTNDQSTPQRQPSHLLDRNNKRASPASDYVNSILRRAKRTKT